MRHLKTCPSFLSHSLGRWKFINAAMLWRHSEVMARLSADVTRPDFWHGSSTDYIGRVCHVWPVLERSWRRNLSVIVLRLHVMTEGECGDTCWFPPPPPLSLSLSLSVCHLSPLSLPPPPPLSLSLSLSLSFFLYLSISLFSDLAFCHPPMFCNIQGVNSCGGIAQQ